MKTTALKLASRALFPLLASAALCTPSRGSPQNTGPIFSLGIETQALSEARRMREGYRAGGVLVTAVAAGSAAARASIEPGDVLVSLGSRVLRNPYDVRTAETGVEQGRPVSAVVARNAGRLIRIFDIIFDLSAGPDAEVAETSAPRPATTEFGIRCDNLGREGAAELGAPEGCGVLVRHVNAGSTADAAGIAPGDVVTFAADKPVTNVDELEAIITDAGSPLVIVTVRDGTTRHLTAEFVMPTSPIPGPAQLAGAASPSAGPGPETAAVDAAASQATPGPATAAGAHPGTVATVPGPTAGSQTASDALVAALREEVLSLREEVRKLREEIAKQAR